MYKDANVTYDINSRRSDGRATNIQFMTQDTGSAKLSFSFTKDGVPLPLSAVDAKIVLLYPDGSFYKKSLTLVDKVNGKAEYILSDAELKHPGIVKAELKLYYTNGQALATSFFTFTISKTLEDQNIVPVAEYYIDDVESFRAGLNKTMDEISQTVEELKAKFADLENIETKDGAQEKADTAEQNAKDYTNEHANDQTKHITTKERETWNAKETPFGAQEKVNVHAADLDLHLVAGERDNWNAKETPDGAQRKVDFHENKTEIHVTSEEKSSWNDVISQFRAHNYNQERHTSAIERAKWNGAVTYANITLKNGAAAGTRTPIYARWGPLLLLRGHVKTEPEIIFGSIPASYVPAGGAVVSIALSGTGGTANLIVYENGDLKIKYPDPTDSSKLGGGFYIDKVIGFQEGGTV
ncbi:phage baseplate upper protein [Bacillus inaquosorum]|nr:phage baseplate upper protein [Bacillus inaquosorum]MCY8276496.1 phage baseplate upper protein [Bacillus inaquosorum]MCY8281196.1 phage baseplate upper protein [Bacillus inaquosorum]